MFGLSPDQARQAVTDNCRAVILHGGLAVSSFILRLRVTVLLLIDVNRVLRVTLCTIVVVINVKNFFKTFVKTFLWK